MNIVPLKKKNESPRQRGRISVARCHLWRERGTRASIIAKALSVRYRCALFDVAYCSRNADIMRGSRSGLQSVY